MSGSSAAVKGSGQVTSGRYRVYTGAFATLEAAEEARDKIAKTVGYNPVVRKEG
jgi:cell division protein FtsN